MIFATIIGFSPSLNKFSFFPVAGKISYSMEPFIQNVVSQAAGYIEFKYFGSFRDAENY